MTDTLIERLRSDLPYKKVESHWITDYTAVEIQNREAADRIEALEAALREADRMREGIRQAGVKRDPHLYQAVMAYDAARVAIAKMERKP